MTDPTLGPALAERFDHILVDEYQDTNLVQADILRAMATQTPPSPSWATTPRPSSPSGGRRCATSSTSRSISRGTSTVTLEQNYRSTTPILELANAVIAGVREGVPKQLWTDTGGGARPTLATCPDQQAQAMAVSQTILDHYESGIALRHQAVLFRTGHHSDLLEVELRRRRIPFVKYGGLRFLEAAHVRDLLAMLRLVQNPWDELAWVRVLHLAHGTGPTSIEKVLGHLGVRDPGRSGPDPLAMFCSSPESSGAAPRSAADLAALAAALGSCRDNQLSAGTQVDVIRGALEPMIRRRYDHPEARLADFDALSGIAADAPNAHQLVADLTLDPPTSTGDLAANPSLDDDWLTLSTVHSAKGGEWGVVHLIHAADGAFPSDLATGSAEEVDEERRLFYVALTRAKHHLHIYAPLRYHHGDPAGWTDKHSYAQRTRFSRPTWTTSSTTGPSGDPTTWSCRRRRCP